MEKLVFVVLGFVCLVAVCNAGDAGSAKEQKEFDGVGIGLVERPKICKKTTRKGDIVRVTFNVSIGDGKAFESRYENEPLEFVIGDGIMIGGFEAGLQDMCLGEIRHITVPPKFGYGSNGIGNLPSRVNLYFFVKMLSFRTPDKKEKKSTKPNAWEAIDTDKDHMISHDEVKAYLEANGAKDVPGEEGIKQITRDIFREEDRNANGVIEWNEFSGIKHNEL